MADPHQAVPRTEELEANAHSSTRRRIGSDKNKLMMDEATCPEEVAGIAPTRLDCDSTSKKFTKIRMMVFFFYASISSICPFEPLWLSAKGIESEVLGSLQAIFPVVTLIAAPLWGRFADQSKAGQLGTLMLTFGMSTAARLLMTFTWHSLYLLVPVKIAMALFYAPVKGMMDGVIISSLTTEEEKLKFGRLRLWGQIGTGASSAVMIFAMNSSQQGYDLIFVMSSLLSLPAFWSMMVFQPHQTCDKKHPDAVQIRDKNEVSPNKVSSSILWNELPLLAKDARVILLLSLVLVSGFSFGFIETFSYPHVRLHYSTAGHQSILGMDMSAGRVLLSLGGVVMYWFSGPLGAAVGPPKVLLLSMLGLIAQFFYYGNISGDHVDAFVRGSFYLAEFLRGATFALFMSTAMTYAHAISPQSMRATMLQLIEATYRGMGFMSGSFIGGKLVAAWGSASVAFLHAGRSMSSLSVLVATVFVTLWTKDRLLKNRRAGIVDVGT